MNTFITVYINILIFICMFHAGRRVIMKKLNKNFNLKKENLESYNVFYGCDCDCTNYCTKTLPSYNAFKRVQGRASMYEGL